MAWQRKLFRHTSVHTKAVLNSCHAIPHWRSYHRSKLLCSSPRMRLLFSSTYFFIFAASSSWPSSLSVFARLLIARASLAPIRLGNMIADPFKPTKPLSIFDSSPPIETVTTTEFERTTNRDRGRSLHGTIWAQFLQSASA
jgi:hypothetical protein